MTDKIIPFYIYRLRDFYMVLSDALRAKSNESAGTVRAKLASEISMIRHNLKIYISSEYPEDIRAEIMRAFNSLAADLMESFQRSHPINDFLCGIYVDSALEAVRCVIE